MATYYRIQPGPVVQIRRYDLSDDLDPRGLPKDFRTDGEAVLLRARELQEQEIQRLEMDLKMARKNLETMRLPRPGEHFVTLDWCEEIMRT